MIYLKKIKQITAANQKLKVEGKINILELTYKNLRSAWFYPSISFMKIELTSNQVKQYLSQKLFKHKLNQSIILSATNKSPQKFPLPQFLLLYLENQNHRIMWIRSSLNWRYLALLYAGYSLYYAIVIFFTKRKSSIYPINSLGIYLHNLSAKAVSISKTGCHLDNAITFFKERGAKSIIVHGVKHNTSDINPDCIYVKTPFDNLNRLNKCKLLIFEIALILRSIVDLVFGSGLLAFVSHQLLLKKAALLLDKECIPNELAFHNSDFAYYPAWVETLASKGASPILYFYSQNIWPYQLNKHISDWHFNYELMTWPRYLVWNKELGNALLDLTTGNPSIEYCRPISFTDKDVEIKKCSGAIAIFDVSPVRESYFAKYGIIETYFTSKVLKQFFSQIITIAENLNKPLIVKFKRVEFSDFDKRYKYVRERLNSHPLITIIDPDISAHRIIRDCDGVISLPFTSTAIIAHYYKKPSIYFDPTARLILNQPAAQGIEIINNKKALEVWMKKVGN